MFVRIEFAKFIYNMCIKHQNAPPGGRRGILMQGVSRVKTSVSSVISDSGDSGRWIFLLGWRPISPYLDMANLFE
jgi:hypothetical protein